MQSEAAILADLFSGDLVASEKMQRAIYTAPLLSLAQRTELERITVTATEAARVQLSQLFRSLAAEGKASRRRAMAHDGALILEGLAEGYRSAALRLNANRLVSMVEDAIEAGELEPSTRSLMLRRADESAIDATEAAILTQSAANRASEQFPGGVDLLPFLAFLGIAWAIVGASR